MFQTFKPTIRLLLMMMIPLPGLNLLSAPQEPSAGQGQKPSDNTKVNERDRSKSEPTADQQKENRSDRELAKQIRRALMKDKSLSTNAHNVKVIAQNGMVTLKGPVKSEEEKQAVEAKAAQIAGSDKVTSEIQVAPK